jgi:hypothetical protein
MKDNISVRFCRKDHVPSVECSPWATVNPGATGAELEPLHTTLALRRSEPCVLPSLCRGLWGSFPLVVA